VKTNKNMNRPQKNMRIQGLNLFLRCCYFYLAAYPAVRCTSLAGRYSYYGCGGLLPLRLLALIVVACRLRAVPLPSGAVERAENGMNSGKLLVVSDKLLDHKG